MLPIIDYKTSADDDIILNGDINEGSLDESVMNVAERRLVSRYDDYLFDPISAGLERFIFQHKTFITQENIKTAITDSLISDSLFLPSDFDIIIEENNNRSMNIIIRFNNIMIESYGLFKIVVDIENQRVFKGV